MAQRERGLTARRLYDERGTLLAGDWRRRDEVQTLYQHGTRPRLQLTPDKRDRLPLVLKTFGSWICLRKSLPHWWGTSTEHGLKRKPGAYVIHVREYRKRKRSDVNKLMKATLTLTRSDLHAAEEHCSSKKAMELASTDLPKAVLSDIRRTT